MYLVTAAEMQTIDRLTIESFGLPGRVLMENAGREAVRVFRTHFAEAARNGVGVAAGRGNNGGDGFVIARGLAQAGYPVRVYLFGTADRVAGDAAANLKLLAPISVPVVELPDEAAFSRHQREMRDVAVWVDAILGTGLTAAVKGFFGNVFEFINQLHRPVLAVDIPSGLSADTGQVDGACIRATVTVTFGYAKIGHAVFPGAEFTGRLEVVDIGIPPHIAERVRPRHFLLTAADVRGNFTPRPADAHKGRTGHLLVVAGSPGKTGAAAMTAAAALRVGAGRVTLGVAQGLHPILQTLVLEAMTAPLPETDSGSLGQAALDALLRLTADKSCLAIGPGLGQDPETGELVAELVRRCPLPLVIDADGLNHLAGRLEIFKGLAVQTVLTPHPGEMARLTGASISAVQRDRIAFARDLAVALNIHVVLKGARTVIAHPDGSVYVNPTGNPGMASAGMGDVLTGMIAGLIAQGMRPDTAARTAVYLHGAAADTLSRTRAPYGFLAGEVAQALPGEIARLLRED